MFSSSLRGAGEAIISRAATRSIFTASSSSRRKIRPRRAERPGVEAKDELLQLVADRSRISRRRTRTLVTTPSDVSIWVESVVHKAEADVHKPDAGVRIEPCGDGRERNNDERHPDDCGAAERYMAGLKLTQTDEFRPAAQRPHRENDQVPRRPKDYRSLLSGLFANGLESDASSDHSRQNQYRDHGC